MRTTRSVKRALVGPLTVILYLPERTVEERVKVGRPARAKIFGPATALTSTFSLVAFAEVTAVVRGPAPAVT